MSLEQKTGTESLEKDSVIVNQSDNLSSSELVIALKKHLEDWNIVKIVSEINNPIYESWLSQNASELIPLLASYLTSEMELKAPSLIQTIEEALNIIAIKGRPKENLLALLEHCSSTSERVKFLSILRPLSLTLKSFESQRHKYWVWALQVVITHISFIPLPSNLNLINSKERLLYENDSNVTNHLIVLNHVVIFVSELVDFLRLESSLELSLSQLISQFIYKLFYKPLMFLDIQKNDVSYKYISERLFSLFLSIETEPMKWKLKIFDNNFEKSPLALASLTSHLFESDVGCNALPQVYSSEYLFNHFLPSVSTLLNSETQHEVPILKGLQFLNRLLSRLERGSISSFYLESSTHSELLNALTHTIIYNESKEIRSLAFTAYNTYYEFLTIDARYKFFNYVLKKTNHSGLIGHMTTKLKDTFMVNYNQNLKYKCFCGESLKTLLKSICKLSHDEQTDLLEISDELLSALNALIVCYALDRSDRKTGIWDFKEELTTDYLLPIKRAIDVSRTNCNYKLYMDKIQSNDTKFSTLTVSGQMLPQMSNQEIESVMTSALTTIDLIEMTLNHLNEYLNE